MQKVSVTSDLGRLNAVIVHSPGAEVEKMTPVNAQRALYSDILNLDVAKVEYNQFKSVLNRFCTVYEVGKLLAETLAVKGVAKQLIDQVETIEGDNSLHHVLVHLPPAELSRQLIEGVEMVPDNLSRYLSDERYRLKPLHNFFFTRDASMTVYDQVLIGKMASPVREREAVIMDTIFKYHPMFEYSPVYPQIELPVFDKKKVNIEGGDIMVVADNVLVIGVGVRTSTHGVDYIIELFKMMKKPVQHIIVQELPESPESFIHLDMVFTLINLDACMVYEPLILGHNQYRTIHICIENGKVSSIKNQPDLPAAIAATGIELKPVLCGGTDRWNQDREQWHSGANFLALAPGVIVGYERNKRTLDELDKHGFEVISASEVMDAKLPFPEKPTVITIAGSELARGGGGARCMSMPVERTATWQQ